MYIDTIFSVFIIMTVLALAMTLLPVFMKKFELDMLADDISRSIAVSGQTDVDVEAMAADYGLVLDYYSIELAPDANAESNAAGTGSIIQLAEPFTVSIQTHQTVGLGGILAQMDIPLVSVSKGRSEVYWKELAKEY